MFPHPIKRGLWQIARDNPQIGSRNEDEKIIINIPILRWPVPLIAVLAVRIGKPYSMPANLGSFRVDQPPSCPAQGLQVFHRDSDGSGFLRFRLSFFGT